MKTANRFSLDRSKILRGKKKFGILFSRGKRVTSGSLLIRFRIESAENSTVKNSHAGSILAAFIVPKKHGRAVDRTKTRRLIKESWRTVRPEAEESLTLASDVHIGIVWIGPSSSEKRPTYSEVLVDLQLGVAKLLKRVK